MSADHHAHGGHGADHVPHVLPLSVYFGTWFALIVLTVVTVAVSYVDIGAGNVVVAMLVATVKATTVAALFMHLAWDHKFHSLIIGSSVIFLAIFIGFTMFDTQARGRAESVEADRPADVTRPFAGTLRDQAIKARWQKPAEGEAAHGGHGEHAAPAGSAAGHGEHAAPAGSSAPAASAHH